MKNNFWKNRKIFITGIDGFVGSNLAKALIQNGSKVYGLVKDKKKESLLKYEKLINKCKIYKGDIKDKKILSNIIKKNKVEVCFHLAAQPEVGIANKDPYNTWETNIKTYNLLETIRDNKKHIKSVLIASLINMAITPKKDLPYRSYHLKPRYPYDVSKACADMISKAYKRIISSSIISGYKYIWSFNYFNTIFPDAIICNKNKKFIPK